jgi:hypothetical protein
MWSGLSAAFVAGVFLNKSSITVDNLSLWQIPSAASMWRWIYWMLKVLIYRVLCDKGS